MSRETEIEITQPHFPASKFCIARPSPPKSIYTGEYYNVERNDWSQVGTLWSFRTHAETVLKALRKAIDETGIPSLEQNVCPCGCQQEEAVSSAG